MSSPRFLQIAGPAAEGTMVVMPFWPDDPDPRVARWTADYARRSHGGTPANTDALIYDALHIVAGCIESSGVTNQPADLAADRERIRGCLEHLPTYQGIVGPVHFNADGDAVLQPTVLEARGGKWFAIR